MISSLAMIEHLEDIALLRLPHQFIQLLQTDTIVSCILHQIYGQCTQIGSPPKVCGQLCPCLMIYGALIDPRCSLIGAHDGG
jgi:hypothetical protein